MAATSQSDIDKKLAALQIVFKNRLPNKVAEIESMWNEVLVSESDSALADCHRMAHTLVGTAGTFGVDIVAKIARELEQELLLVINKKKFSAENNLKITGLIEKIKTAAEVWQSADSTVFQALEIKDTNARKGNLIYLVEDDELLAENLISQLEKEHFIVKYFSNVGSFIADFAVEKPDAVIMDIVFEEKGFDGTEAIVELKKKYTDFPPIIFVSTHFDIEARLAAVNAGGQRFLCKPLEANQLSNTLNGLLDRNINKPFRIMIVDDDVELLKYYDVVLSSANMQVAMVSEPMETLKILEEFKPDVIILDVYMPEYSGTDIAKIIRQDDRWALTPIMFLSSENDVNTQSDIMSVDGESFLVKPVIAEQLITAVTAKAKGSRWKYKINNDLKLISRESEFKTITFNQHNIVSSADVKGNIIDVNDSFCKISGYSFKELIGQNHRILKSNKHSAAFYDDMWETISSGNVWHGTLCNISKNGNEYWVESTIVPFLDEKGKPYKYVSARTDVTELIENKERLERSQKFANTGTWDWNIETDDLFWSDRIWSLFGYDKKVTKTSYENFMQAIHPDDRLLVSGAITNCIESMAEYNVEHRVVWPDGSVHWLNESGNVIRDSDNKALRMLGLVQDITEKKVAEEALILARKEAEDANRAKSLFLSSMSHELRTPMNAIMGFGQILSMDPVINDDQKASVEEILKASDHLLNLINEVLDLSKVESGQVELSIDNVQLSDVITESLQLIYTLAEKRGISITILRGDIEIALNDLMNQKDTVRGDYTRIKQVFINLLSNAVKYNKDNGSITIKCSSSSNNTIRISIIDTGIGLNENQKEQLFTSFNRLGAEKTDIEGTGIGLVITKNIVELMGGSIGVETETGKGSTFWFELPNAEKKSSNNMKSDLASTVNIDNAYSVLYIEDNPANLRLISQFLSRFPNVHMWSAHEAMLGIELSLEHNPDLILLDINLPGMDGYEALKLLKENEKTRSTPVIAISANAMKNDIEKGFAAGFDDYITKPINITLLLTAMEQQINKRKV